MDLAGVRELQIDSHGCACAICLEPMTLGERVRQLDCDHCFHAECAWAMHVTILLFIVIYYILLYTIIIIITIIVIIIKIIIVILILLFLL